MRNDRHTRVLHSDGMTLATATDPSTVIDLLARGSDYRDGWIPIQGKVDSGFDLPRPPVALEDLVSPAPPNGAALKAARNQLARLQKKSDVEILSIFSDRYPRRLQDLNGRPSLLFVQGKWVEPSIPVLAIAGAREAGPEARTSAYEVGRIVTQAGHVIVSGLAAGIDSCAHHGAIDAGGRTIAVMGTGLGLISPRSNSQLARRITRQGALVSQFPPGHAPTKTSFPARNAVIAGLADVSLLVEMRERSGSRIEANCSLRQGKPTLLWAPQLGSHRWARDLATEGGATFVSSADEVLEVLNRCHL
jgi:DNA processing protein